MGALKFWNGSTWATATDVMPKIWNGSNWGSVTPKIYDGAGWVTYVGLEKNGYAEGAGVYSPGTAQITFENNGTITGIISGGSTWITSTSADGSLYELYVTGSGLTSGTTNTWLRLNTSPTFSLTSDNATVDLTCYVRRYGESGTPASKTISLHAYGDYPYYP